MLGVPGPIVENKYISWPQTELTSFFTVLPIASSSLTQAVCHSEADKNDKKKKVVHLKAGKAGLKPQEGKKN